MDEILIVGLCLVLNALFAGYEMAFVSVPKSELRALAKNGNKNAKTLIALRESPERTLSIIQIGITLVGALAAAVGGAGAAENLEPYFIEKLGFTERTAEIIAVVIVVLPLTYLSVVIGELVPKSLALRNPRKIVLAGAKVLIVADRVLSPFVSILEMSTKFILHTFFHKQKSQEENLAHSAIEIDSLSPVHQRFMIIWLTLKKN